MGVDARAVDRAATQGGGGAVPGHGGDADRGESVHGCHPAADQALR